MVRYFSGDTRNYKPKLNRQKATQTNGIAVDIAHHGKEKGMIKIENGKVMMEGNGITLMAELACAANALKSSGIPGDAILHSVRLGLEDTTEEDVLMENFVNELMRKVMEKRDAKKDKGSTDTYEG